MLVLNSVFVHGKYANYAGLSIDQQNREKIEEKEYGKVYDKSFIWLTG
jgi:hypothetical protein